MKNKKLLLSITASCLIASVLWAADNLGVYSDASKVVPGSRWQTSRQATVVVTNAAAVNITNVVLSTGGIVGKITWVPGDIGDKFELHTASAVTSAAITVGNEIFVVNSTTNTTTGVPVGYPQSFNFETAPLNATNGIVCIVKPATTASVSRVFIQFDQNR